MSPCGGPYGPSAEEVNEGLKILLCSACRSLGRLGYDFDENPLLSRWWVEHRKAEQPESGSFTVPEAIEFMLNKELGTQGLNFEQILFKIRTGRNKK